MRRILSIVKATTIEILGEPLSLLLLLAALAVTILSPVFHFHQFGEVTRMSRDAGFSAQFMLGTAFAVFCTIKSFRREIESGTMDMALAHSVSRTDFFLAKTAGIAVAYTVFAATVLFTSAVMVDGAAVGGIIAGKTGDLPRIWAPAVAFSLAVVVLPLVIAAGANYFFRRRFTLIASCSMLAVSALSLAVVSFLVRDIGYFVRMIPVAVLVAVLASVYIAVAAAAAVRLKANAAAVASFVFVALSLPFVGNYFLSEALAKGGAVPWGYVAAAIAAALPALAAALSVGAAFLRRNE